MSLTPDEFSTSMGLLTELTTAMVSLPLGEMQEYIDEVERLAELPGNDLTDQQRKNATFMARIIASAIHMRVVAQMGGKSVELD